MTPARARTVMRPVREDHLGASTFIEKGWHLIAQGDFQIAQLEAADIAEFPKSRTYCWWGTAIPHAR